MNRGPFELRDVSKLYDGHAALSSVSFAIADGEHTALLGLSGCGGMLSVWAVETTAPCSHTSPSQGVSNPASSLSAVDLPHFVSYIFSPPAGS